MLLPQVHLPLHIFEPRYRQLTIDLVTDAVPGREFGVIAIRTTMVREIETLDHVHGFGCTALLREAKRLPDGRFDVVTSNFYSCGPLHYFGNNGEIVDLLKKIKDIPKEERPAFGQEANRLKVELTQAYDAALAREKERTAGRPQRRGQPPGSGSGPPVPRSPADER